MLEIIRYRDPSGKFVITATLVVSGVSVLCDLAVTAVVVKAGYDIITRTNNTKEIIKEGEKRKKEKASQGFKGKGQTGKEKSEKGKSFRGGSKKSRDKWYGKNDKEFQKWWERQGKKSYGEDIQDSKMAEEVYKEWIDLGKPKAR